MQTIAVIDASVVISGTISTIDYAQGYMPECVVEEVKCVLGKERLFLHSYKITARNPAEGYVERAAEKAKELGYTGLSAPDIALAALALELSEEIPSVFSSWITPSSQPAQQVLCITEDRTLKGLVAQLGVCNHDAFAGDDRKFLQRCYTCTKTFTGDKKVDFCTHCGYATVTRVSYQLADNQIQLFLKKGFNYSEKHIMFRGKEIKGQDQKEYKWYQASQNRQARAERKQAKQLMQESEWEL